MLAAAHHHFRHKARHQALAEPLAAIETALGERVARGGDVDARRPALESRLDAAAGRVAMRGPHVAARDRAAMRAAFRLGGAARRFARARRRFA